MPVRRPRFRRHLADLLSATNAACGLASVAFAATGRPEVSLLLLFAGALCDGLDGAAARRFGSTRIGVLADDVADFISYALAPGVAVAVSVSGVAGTMIGTALVLLTASRLVYFTLMKGREGDVVVPIFRGLPSTVGGVVALGATILWPQEPAVVGFFVGVVAVAMVSFDAGFVHLGRLMGTLDAAKRQRLIGYGVVVVAAAMALGPTAVASMAMACALTYVGVPSVTRFLEALRPRTPPTTMLTSTAASAELQ